MRVTFACGFMSDSSWASPGAVRAAMLPPASHLPEAPDLPFPPAPGGAESFTSAFRSRRVLAGDPVFAAGSPPFRTGGLESDAAGTVPLHGLRAHHPVPGPPRARPPRAQGPCRRGAGAEHLAPLLRDPPPPHLRRP